MSLLDRILLPPECKVRFGEAKAFSASCDSVARAFPGVSSQTPEDIKLVVAKLEGALQNWSWRDVKIGDIAIVAAATLTGRVVISVRLRAFLMEELSVTTRSNLTEALCEAYLESWTAGRQETKTLAELIVTRSKFLPSRRQELFRQCPEILDPERGAEELGRKLVSVTEPFEWLRDVGIAAPHGPGFMAATHYSFLDALPPAKSNSVVRKILKWVAPNAATKLEGDRAVAAVEKILGPWRKSTAPEDLKNDCARRLTELFGDPRKERKDFWLLVSEEHRRVMLKWLAGKSMEAIFEIVSRAEDVSGDRNQWNKRKRFWMGQYSRGVIEEAWVALGPEARGIADRLYRDTGDPAYRSYGRQNTRRNTSLLFMKIGNKIIVEGSHSFRVHIFPVSQRQTPVLYQSRYDLTDIILPTPHPNARMHDVGDKWMAWVQRRLR